MTDLTAAAQALSAAQNVVDSGIARLAEIGIDDNQVLAYDVAHGAAAVQTGQSLLNSYGDKGEIEAKITVAFIADAIAEMMSPGPRNRSLSWTTPRAASSVPWMTATGELRLSAYFNWLPKFFGLPR